MIARKARAQMPFRTATSFVRCLTVARLGTAHVRLEHGNHRLPPVEARARERRGAEVVEGLRVGAVRKEVLDQVRCMGTTDSTGMRAAAGDMPTVCNMQRTTDDEQRATPGRAKVVLH